MEIDLYESASQFTQVGAGISVWKRTWYIIQLLGLDGDLGKMAVKSPVDVPRKNPRIVYLEIHSPFHLEPGFIFRKSDQEEEGFNFYQMMTPCQLFPAASEMVVRLWPHVDGSITLHRADMLKILTDNLPPASRFRAHFSKRLAFYTSARDSGDVVMHFMDGTTATADVLIGADGIKSATRNSMYSRLASKADIVDQALARTLRNFKDPSWTGTYAYRSLIDAKELLRTSPNHQSATNPMIVSVVSHAPALISSVS